MAAHGHDLTQAILTYIQGSLLNGREIGPEEDLLLSGLLDSLAVASMVAELERIGGVRVPPQDVTIQNFKSIRAMVAYVEGRRGT